MSQVNLRPQPLTRKSIARSNLAGMMAGQDTTLWETTPEELFVAAQDEGVAALIAQKLSSANLPHHWPASFGDAAKEVAMAEAMTSMSFQAEARKILDLLAETGERVLILKGLSLAYWAYPYAHLRACGDIDLLLPSRLAAERLAKLLTALGFQQASSSGDLVAYELMCSRNMSDDWDLEVDVHWRLNNSPQFANVLGFDELWAASIPLPKLHPAARGLGPAHAMLHASIHRALNMSFGMQDKLKWLFDFVMFERCFSQDDWSHLTTLARDRQLAGVTLNALEAASATFGINMPHEVLETLRLAARQEPLDAARLSDWRYMQAQTLRALPGLRPKLTWLWQRLFPSRDYMTYLYGDKGGYAGLLFERARRAWRKWRG